MALITSLRRLAIAAAVAAALLVASPARAAEIGLLILEGSDSQTFHNFEPYSSTFLTGMTTFSSAPTKPLFIFGSAAQDEVPQGASSLAVGFVASDTLPTLTEMLDGYSGIYISSPFNCCDERPLTSDEADTIRAFLEAGRSVAIEDYQGGAEYDVIIGNTGAFAGTANAHVAGFGGGFGGIGSCFDGNVVAAHGSAYGLGPVGTVIPPLGCFGHQAYEAAFFDALGLDAYIATNPGLRGYNVVISNGGGGLDEAVPEPLTLSLVGIGLAGLGVARRRRK
jgi:hypothetical protein